MRNRRKKKERNSKYELQGACPLRCIAYNAAGFAKYLYLLAGLHVKSAEYLLPFLKQ